MRRGKHWLGAVVVVAACALPGPAAAQPEPLAMEEVAPGHFVHRGVMEERAASNLGDQANIGFVIGERCVAIVDPGGSLPVGQALLAAVRRVTGRPVCYVVLTHFHPDHFFGAAAFRDEGAEFVAHHEYPKTLAVRARPYANSLKRDLGDLAAGSDIVAPTRLVQDELALDLGGRTLRLKAWPVAHTDNDLTVFDETTGTLWLGDLLFLQHTPVVDGSIHGFLKVLDALAALPVARYVAGHGRSDRPWPEVLRPQRDYLAMLVRETRAALKARKTLEQAVDTVGHSAAGDWLLFDLFHRRNVTATYAELEWED